MYERGFYGTGKLQCIILTFTGGNFLRNCVVAVAAVAVSFAVPFIVHPDPLPFSPNPTKGHHA